MNPSPQPTPLPLIDPSPEAGAAVDAIVASLPESLPADVVGAVTIGLDDAARSFADLGMTSEQQVASVDALAAVVAELVAEPGVSPAQVLQAIDAAAAVVPSLLELSPDLRARVLDGLADGLAQSGGSLADGRAQRAVVQTVVQVVQALANGEQGDLVTADIVRRLITTTAAAMSEGVVAGEALGVTTRTAVVDGFVRFIFSEMEPGTTAIVSITVDATADAAALRALFRDRLIGLSSGEGGTTFVLSGTVNELGVLQISVPWSILGVTSAEQAKTAVDRTVLGLAGTAATGAVAVFAGPAAQVQLVMPRITARLTPVVPHRAPAVLMGGAQPGATVTLYGRTFNSPYRELRRLVADASGLYFFTVYPNATTRFYVKTTDGSTSADSTSTLVQVRSAVTQAVVRTAPRTYRFSGRVTPAVNNALVTVFYSTPSTGSVLAARARTRSDGTWSVSRTFAGSGTLSVFSRVVSTPYAVGGLSPVQRITIR